MVGMIAMTIGGWRMDDSSKYARYIGAIMITITIAPCAVKYTIH
jgi:hypothetical protein